jgi:ATP-dependent helicase IRC3
MIGRGLRLFPGKKNCHVIDMVASLETGVLSTPTLFGLDPDEVLDNTTAKEIRESKQEESLLEPSSPVEDELDEDVQLQFTKYDSIYDLLGDTRYEKHIRSLSRYSWVRVSDDKYILSDSSGWLALEREKGTDGFVVRHVMKFKDPVTEKPTFTKPRHIASGPDLETTVRAGDTFASSKFEEHYISSRKAWRQNPATSSQIQMLNRARIRTEKVSQEGLTRGQAADMITKLKFGGKKRYETMLTQRRKTQKREEELSELRRRTDVKVGPLVG